MTSTVVYYILCPAEPAHVVLASTDYSDVFTSRELHEFGGCEGIHPIQTVLVDLLPLPLGGDYADPVPLLPAAVSEPSDTVLCSWCDSIAVFGLESEGDQRCTLHDHVYFSTPISLTEALAKMRNVLHRPRHRRTVSGDVVVAPWQDSDSRTACVSPFTLCAQGMCPRHTPVVYAVYGSQHRAEV